ncbi:MAG: hypothetical protein RLY86_2939 [Pseudomonadota bacterium]|jgi:hypothetical protein
MSEGQWMSLIASLVVLAMLFPGLRSLPRQGMLRNIVIWLVIFAVLGLLYNAFGGSVPTVDVPAGVPRVDV